MRWACLEGANSNFVGPMMLVRWTFLIQYKCIDWPFDAPSILATRSGHLAR